MEKEYIHLIQEKIESTKQNIENLEKEAISFSVAKKEMQHVVKEFIEITKKFQTVLDSTSAINEEVSKITVESTLAKMDRNVEDITNTFTNFREENNNAMESNLAELKKNLFDFTELIVIHEEKIMNQIDNNFAKMDSLLVETKKRNVRFVLIVCSMVFLSILVTVIFSLIN